MINFDQKITFRNRSSELAMKYELASIIVELSEKARNEGLLNLDELVDDFIDAVNKNPKDVDFKLMLILLRMSLRGFDTDFTKNIGENYILNSNATDLEKRLMEFVMEGMISIQSGDNPAIMCEKLASLVGIENYESFFSHINSNLPKEYGKIQSCLDKDFYKKTSEGTTISQDEIDEFLNSQNQ